MSTTKKAIRDAFRLAVFKRDDHRCRTCGKGGVALDAHHITPRDQMPGGGYVVENGISLCYVCHLRAETHFQEKPHQDTWSRAGDYAPAKLYALIGSSILLALHTSLMAIAASCDVAENLADGDDGVAS